MLPFTLSLAFRLLTDSIEHMGILLSASGNVPHVAAAVVHLVFVKLVMDSLRFTLLSPVLLTTARVITSGVNIL